MNRNVALSNQCQWGNRALLYCTLLPFEVYFLQWSRIVSQFSTSLELWSNVARQLWGRATFLRSCLAFCKDVAIVQHHTERSVARSILLCAHLRPYIQSQVANWDLEQKRFQGSCNVLREDVTWYLPAYSISETLQWNSLSNCKMFGGSCESELVLLFHTNGLRQNHFRAIAERKARLFPIPGTSKGATLRRGQPA